MLKKRSFSVLRRQTLAALALFGLGAKPSLALKDPEILQVLDPTTKRVLKLKLRLPAQKTPTALLLYSPGLGSGVSNGAAWCEAWRQAGYLVVTLAHPVTDDSIWKTSQKKSLKSTIAEAIAAPQYALRVKDCSFALDYLLELPMLKPYLDATRIGIAGHSYGALTVQSITGQGGTGLLDRRIKAAIAFSPSAMSQERAAAMGQVKVPFFCITGTLDGQVTFKDGTGAVRLGVPVSQRQWVYDHLPVAHRQELLVAQADHMSFAGEPIDALHFSREAPESEQNNAHTWQRVSTLTTEFWNFYLGTQVKPIDHSREAYHKRMQAAAGPQDRLRFD